MAHLNYFGVENFRVFKENTSFDLKPITVLVGTNSSGKSSLIKAIEFLKGDFRINFINKVANFMNIEISKGLELGGFNNIKNNNNYESEIISFSYPFFIPGTTESLRITISYKKSSKSKNGLDIFEVKVFRKDNPENPVVFKNHFEEHLKIDFTQLHDILVNNYGTIKNNHEESETNFFKVRERYDYDKNEWIDTFSYNNIKIVPNEKLINRHWNVQRILLTQIDENGEKEVLDDLTYKHYGVDFGSFKSFLIGFKELKTPDFLEKADLETSKSRLNSSILPFFVFINEDYLKKIIPEENYIDTLIRLQSYKKELLAKYGENWKDYLLKLQLKEMTENSFFPFYNDVTEKNDFFSWTLLEPPILFQNFERSEESTLQTMYLHNDYLTKYFMMDFFVDEFIFKGINSAISSLFETYSQLEFVPSLRSNIKRILFDNKERSFFETCVEKINKIGLSKEALYFLKKNLLQFEIANDIFIDIDENTSLTTVKLSIGNSLIFLADVGYGISQLLPILLRIAINVTENEPDYKMRWYYKSSIIVIEEPETNLHPALQSKLADLFIECYEKYDIQFIIETHSEYLIRKLQYLVAKKDFKAEDTVIYNFRKATDDNPEIVKRIDIDENGGLSKNFYPGFFDESDNLAISLFNLNNKN
ncbi:DUF3696 domain-containing protein [Lacihabitans sp. CCS-44]|uniref:AAA family ATPase n=1 Tax=Lacihabitans sp. CCS-44 TaxID=2487331 RepID=UPI0020CE1EAC|nr:AAA family ATPase [Lacihabitans sp. CCS-44]MCP9755179.1 DUF3696 domain-containing protein [Lacihabitans sp. CCS-44]